jgi:hypothetical protein
VPGRARSLATIPRIDYADTFLLDISSVADRTPEQWARAVLEGAPAAVRNQCRLAWTAIGLKLDTSHSGRPILGWQVRAETPGYVLLGAESRIGMPAELLFKCERDTLLFATFVQHRNPLARMVWAAIEPAHAPTVRYILEHGRERILRETGTSVG